MDTEGCTAFPEGDWHECCVAHDRAYRDAGYGIWNWGARRNADIALYKCVRAKGHPHIAALMFLGVRLFALPAWVMNRWTKE